MSENNDLLTFHNLLAENTRLRSENDELKNENNFAYCGYCGYTVERADTDALQIVQQHIVACEKHPMRAVELERDQSKVENARLQGIYLAAVQRKEALFEIIADLLIADDEYINNLSEVIKKLGPVLPYNKLIAAHDKFEEKRLKALGKLEGGEK